MSLVSAITSPQTPKGKSIKERASTLQHLNRQIARMNDKMKLEDDYLMTLLFNSLPAEYETTLETIQGNETYKDFDKILGVLKIREGRRQQRALLARNEKRNDRACVHCGKISHKAADCWYKPSNEYSKRNLRIRREVKRVNGVKRTKKEALNEVGDPSTIVETVEKGGLRTISS